MKRATRLRLLATSILMILLMLMIAGPALGAASKVGSGASIKIPGLAAALPAVTSSRTWTDASTGVQEVIEERSLYAPPTLDRQVTYPDVLNNIPYMRYAVAGTAADSSQATAVVIALSGLHGGNGDFDCFAKQLVSKAKSDKGVNIEVWALDRRVNNLEDLTGLNEAERLASAGDVTGAAAAISGYYFQNQPINGKTFQGFYDDYNALFLSEFGLRIAMEDVYTLIKTVFPDQNVRKKKVYVCGDSLGVAMTADFISWDFDGDPNTLDDAGYNNIAGVLALDALMTPNALPITQDMLKFAAGFFPQALVDLLSITGTASYSVALAMIRDAQLSVNLPTNFFGYEPTTYIGVETFAILADFAPKEESQFYQTVAPYMTDPRTDVLLRIAMSKDLFEYYASYIVQKRVRFTNEALFGLTLDNNFNPITMNEASDGFLTGGPVEEKYFPLIGGFPWVPGVSNLISGFMPYDKMYIPSAQEPRQTPWTGPLYTWLNFNEIDGTDAAAYTSSAQEFTDVHDIAKCCYEGPSNVMEWYYTTRLFADILVASADGSEQYGINVLHKDQLANVPTFTRLCGEGTNIGYAWLNGMDTTGLVLPGYHHLDILTANMDRAPNAKNLLYMPLTDWIKSISAPEPVLDPCGLGSGLGVLMLGISLGLLSLAGQGLRRRRKRS
ncbi:MAG: hypothetical protein A2V52_00210 [Actinobacteria bacterium RBG_19FT_COMBO_54_7]|nr:MAG: hypothetical protein A2V52_00210 [Actinobacteria bacterium RBG_19FT_COMBO_54_7]